MESSQPTASDDDYLSASSAAEQLRIHEAVRDRSEGRGPSRGYPLLLLWSAVVLSVYVGAFLWASSSRSGTGGLGTGAYVSVFLLPTLIFSSLIGGARERFSVRAKPSTLQRVAYALVFSSFGVLLVLGIAAVSYPWWLNLAVAVAMFVVTAVGPLRQLRTAAGRDPERWMNHPLSRPAQWTTALIGVAAGLLAATSAQRVLYSVVSVGTMVVLVVVLIAWRSRWGLPRTGYEWGPIHWSAFGVTMTLLFGLGVVLYRTNWITAPLGIAVGAVIFATMFASSLLPVSSPSKS